MTSLFHLFCLWLLSLAGVEDPCTLPELADTPECQEAPASHGPGDHALSTHHTEISNGF